MSGVDGMFFSKVVALANRHFKPGKAKVTIEQAERIRAACQTVQETIEESIREHEEGTEREYRKTVLG